MGLGKRTELNGVLVKLLHWYKQAGRWAVTCAYGFNDKEVLVQPQNLDAGFLHAPVVMQRLSQKVEEILDKLQPKMLKVHGQSQLQTTTKSTTLLPTTKSTTKYY